MTKPAPASPPPSLHDLNRLIKLLGMLDSAHAGERAAAALKVCEWVRAHNITWAELLDPIAAPPVLSVSVGDQRYR